ncbi:FadR/GntR family transcriptional regulator [Billgrantia endophytica]|uniref:FadR family transcriptional regulator n=1 Tax=Billgrantia endophytica TaxID=2033802 RepID=A0A2N7UEG9_9GAMM|nr:FadR/GntR family transcriptional regulator [Halomonas endophytica]PMR78781.1 FadR family transcriptional regulator [Halomonas endophytica]
MEQSKKGSSDPVPQKTARAIQDLIRRHVYKSGEKLPAQRVLAEDLNVSRASLREALSTLEALGFVRTEANRGTFVTYNSDDDMQPIGNWRFSERFKLEEVYEFRYFTEASAIRLATLQATEGELKELKELHENYKKAIQALDLVASGEYDCLFHRSIMIFSRNRVYSSLYEKFQEVFHQSQILPFSRHQRLWEPVMEHGKILEAMLQRDPDGAAYYIQMHMVRAAERLGIRLRNLF